MLAPSTQGFSFGSDSFASSHVVDPPATASALTVGGVVLVPASGADDYAYVAATLTFPVAKQVGLLRLLRHTP